MYVNGKNERYLDEICFWSVGADEKPSLAGAACAASGFHPRREFKSFPPVSVAPLAPAVHECLCKI